MAMRAHPVDEIVADLLNFFQQRFWDSAKALLRDDKRIPGLAEDVISTLIARANDDILNGHPLEQSILPHVEEMLMICVDRGTPRLNLTTLMCAMQNPSPQVFKLLVGPMIHTLNRMEQKRKSKLWPDGLSTMVKYFPEQNIVRFAGEQGATKADSATILDLAHHVATNLQLLISLPDMDPEHQTLIRNTLTHLLEYPCSSMELYTAPKAAKATERAQQEALLGQTLEIARLTYSLMASNSITHLLDIRNTYKPDGYCPVDYPSVPGLLLLVALHMENYDGMTSLVESPFLWRHVAGITMEAINFRKQDSAMTLKMLIAMLRLIDQLLQEHAYIDLKNITASLNSFLVDIVTLILYYENKVVRRKALEVLEKIFQCCWPKSKPILLDLVYRLAEHSGLRSWVMLRVKNEAWKNVTKFGKAGPDEGASEEFIGEKLVTQLKRYFVLPTVMTSSDLFEYEEEVIQGANSMRVLLGPNGKTALGLTEYIEDFKVDFMDRLEKMIQDTRLVLASSEENQNMSKVEQNNARDMMTKLAIIELAFYDLQTLLNKP